MRNFILRLFLSELIKNNKKFSQKFELKNRVQIEEKHQFFFIIFFLECKK
jgi:hypothetical protein